MKLYRILIIVGFLFYAFSMFLIWERNNPDRLAFKNYTGNYKNISIINPPIKIVIKDLRIDLPIFPARIKNNKWDTTTEGASYLTSSPVPGEPGNSIIYAHDWASLFGPLYNVRTNMPIEIEYKDKTIKTFVINKISVVRYDQTEILNSTSDKRITLYTCTGFLDSQRLVAVAEYKQDESL